MRGALWLALCGVAVGVSCSTNQQMAPPATDASTAQVDPANATPGTVLASEPLDPIDIRVTRAGATATRFTYRSTSGIDGAPTTVTGSAFVPRKPPPPGGWPVVVYAHANSGILPNCGPSSQTDLLGNTPQVEMLLRNGYLVVMPDYQGLGSRGPHPYLEPKTVAYNVIDAARAVRELESEASVNWGAYGVFQGGQAAWAAAELAPSYGAGLNMVGALALAPAADMSPLPQAALDRRLSRDQVALMHWIVNSVHRVEPDVALENYLHGFAMENNEALLQCSGSALDTRNRLALQLNGDDVAPDSQQSADRLSDTLRRWSLPQPGESSRIPVMVVVGERDTMVPPDWTKEAVRRACEMGESVVWAPQFNESHDNLNYRPGLAWLTDRFAAEPVDNACVLDGPS